MATNVETIVNQALRALGSRKKIGYIYEGSPESRAALEVYGQTRDELLRAQDWPFARAGGGVPLILLKGPPPIGGYNPAQPWSPAYPANGFLYEYAMPGDCLDLLAIVKKPLSLPNLMPRYNPWREDNDATPIIVSTLPPVVAGPPQKVILTNVSYALAVYRRRVTNPALWVDSLFTEMLVEALARKMALSLGMPLQVTQANAQAEAAAGTLANLKKG